MGKAAQHPATVTRVMRASIKIGHDFLTLEESVVLPVGANDAAIAEAVATGLRIFQAQQSAIEEQISGIRANPPAPRSPKPATANQISFIERLAGNVGHSIASAVETCGFVVEGLTSDQASRVIDLLKLAEIGTDAAPAGTAVDSDEPVPASRATQPITEQQGRAITALCQVCLLYTSPSPRD